MTIHRSKSELKQLRYQENCAKCINTLLEAITFDPTVSVLETRHLELSKDT